MLKKQQGSALLEVMIAAMVLVLILLSIFPTFIYVAKIAATTRQRTIGYNLAVQELEKIKGLDFEEVGLAGGNPSGVVTADKDLLKDGINYHLKTRIRWQDDPGDGLSPTDSDPRDYKIANIDVTWRMGDLNKKVSVSTIITRQSEDQIAVGGNIKTIVKDANNQPVEDAQVSITSGPSAPINDFTNEVGESLFALLDPSLTEGDYCISTSKSGYVVHPQMQIQTTTVATNETRTLEFIIDEPGQLAVTLIDDETGQKINEPSNLNLSFAGFINEYNSENGGFTISNLFPGLWEASASSSTFKSSEPVTVAISRSRTEDITIRLRRLRRGNLHLKVFDHETSSPLPYSSVVLKNKATGQTTTSQTNTQGILEIQLVQGIYDVTVSKSGYVPATEQVDINRPGNTHLDMYLDQALTKGSIMVTCIGYDGAPIPRVRIRVRRGSLSFTGTTDSIGRISFNNLNAGTYTVYRWAWGWRYPRYISVRDGTQSTVTYRF